MKNVGEGAYAKAISAANGTFAGGSIITLGAAEGAVGIPADNPNLDDDVEAKVLAALADIAAGKLVVADTADGLHK